MIHNVVFDMGKVLLDFNVERYLLHVEQEEDRPLVRHVLFESAEWTMTDYGTMDDERLIAAACRRLPQHLHPAAAEIVHTWYRDMPAYPGIGEVIRGLKDEGYRLYLLSNVSGHYEVMRRNIPHIERFDGEFISSDWHLLKPDPEIFRVFACTSGSTPRSAFSSTTSRPTSLAPCARACAAWSTMGTRGRSARSWRRPRARAEARGRLFPRRDTTQYGKQGRNEQ